MSDKINIEKISSAAGKCENSEKNKMDKAFDDYADDAEIKTADIGFISTSVHERLFDVTFGYLISSASGLFFLVALLPIFYITHDGIAKGAQKLPGLDDIFSALGVGWFLILFISAGFFAGGVALFNSMRAGRPILKYMFTLSALIMLFELKYGIDRGGGVSYDGIIFVLSIALCLAMFSALIVRSGKTRSIGLMVLLNALLITFNSAMIIKYFISFNSATADRHVHYLSLVFIAAILIQTIEAVKTFWPMTAGRFSKRVNEK
ncbi:MAG TPA: hypothetical protein DC017_02765 [Candidatus Wallbacteria bacterium]|nr:hypothetical protein [Candidatus Wallbacteria bacterium]